MKFGIHSLLFKETFVEKDLPVLDKCREMGFDAVEIIPFDVDHFPAAKVKQAAADLGLTINTGFGMPLECNTISPDPAVRRKGVELSKRLIDLSNEAGARVFAGAIYCGWGYLSGRMRTEDEWKWGVESTRLAAEYAAETSDLIIGIEPLDPEMEKIAKLTAIWRKLADSPEQLATEGLQFLQEVWRDVQAPSPE